MNLKIKKQKKIFNTCMITGTILIWMKGNNFYVIIFLIKGNFYYIANIDVLIIVYLYILLDF